MSNKQLNVGTKSISVFNPKEKVKVDLYSGNTFLGNQLGSYKGFTENGRIRIHLLGTKRDASRKIRAFKPEYVHRLSPEEREKYLLSRGH